MNSFTIKAKRYYDRINAKIELKRLNNSVALRIIVSIR